MRLRLNSDLSINIKFVILICIFGFNLRTCEGGLKDNVQINGANLGNGSMGRTTLRDAGQENYELIYHKEEDDDDFGEDEDDEEFDSKSLIEFVENMESEARHDTAESLGIVPNIYEYFTTRFGTPKLNKNSSSNLESRVELENERTFPDELDLPEDISDTYFHADVVDDIAAGIEESLALSGRENPKGDEKPSGPENREFAFYMFQGQYIAEPRLNLFVDGAIRNLASEMKLGIMDPLYFRVLPRGQVTSRLKPRRQGLQGLNIKNQLTKKPGRNQRVRRRRPIRRRQRKQGVRVRQRKVNTAKRNPKQRIFQQRRRQAAKARQRKRRNQQRQRQAAQRKIRKRRQARKGVGSGRVEGLSKVQRDGDAEMQMFGNYTMIRCHAKMGPVVLNMQFRTRRGLRRTGATLPEIKIHSVTRVSPAGSEMVDFILDRPHPETIKLRGKLFPLAERVAKNIFARLFMPGSFLVSRIREKSAAAMLSKPKIVSYG